MPNRMILADKLKKEYTVGLPDGLNEEFIRSIPHLFARIDELERALAPFAYAGKINEQYHKEMTEVRMSDCLNAKNLLDPNQSLQPKQNNEIWYPAL